MAQETQIKQNRLFVKVIPTSLHVPYVGRSLRVSCEYRIKEYFSIENEFGFFFDNSKGYIAKFEFKYYFDKPNEGLYCSGELYYKNQNYSTSDNFGNELKEYTVNKNIECLTIKWGNLRVFKYGFIVEPYAGIGIRFQQNRNSLSATDNLSMEATTDYGPNIILNQARNRVYPNITAGIKVGLRLKN